jgi:DNA-binding NarL/FixJ family response regulator
MEEFEEQIEDMMEEKLQETSEKLSSISNDKLLGMDEYSSQVLERISNNHEEVVFLYNMLNEKEEEIKSLVHHVDSVKAQIHEETAAEYQKIMEILKQLQEKTNALARATAAREAAISPSLVKTQAENLARTAAGELAGKQADVQSQPAQEEEEPSQDTEEMANHNQEILDLYQKGHSVLEISKLLSLGQGEVKFVIDLHENK